MPEIRKLTRVAQDMVKILGVTSGDVRVMGEPQNKIIYTDGMPRGGRVGDLLAKKSNRDRDVEWITPAHSVEQDNTRPITSAAVYAEIGNINVLLESI